MSDKKPHPAVVGAFVIGAIALLILAALALGGRGLFERKLECVAYFDENIGGLDVGAPVEYEGVRIGTVTGVRIEFDLPTHRFYRPVRFQIEPSRISADSTFTGSPGDLLARLVTDHGLRAQLANQSLLTGKLKITLGKNLIETLLPSLPGLIDIIFRIRPDRILYGFYGDEQNDRNNGNGNQKFDQKYFKKRLLPHDLFLL